MNTPHPTSAAAPLPPTPIPLALAEAERHIRHYEANPSPLGIRVAALLEQWEGLHHIANPDRINWDDDYSIRMTYTNPLDTFDFDRLTRLVFLAHDHCVRVQVTGKPGPGRDMLIMFHAREREGAFSKRHPSLETAVAAWRKNNPNPLVP